MEMLRPGKGVSLSKVEGLRRHCHMPFDDFKKESESEVSSPIL